MEKLVLALEEYETAIIMVKLTRLIHNIVVVLLA